jgi:hypothetical protein
MNCEATVAIVASLLERKFVQDRDLDAIVLSRVSAPAIAPYFPRMG